MARKRMGLGDRHKRILDYLSEYQTRSGYPPSIREIGEKTGISSTSVVNYYLDQLEQAGYIERESHISRGIRVLKTLPDSEGVGTRLVRAAQTVAETVNDMLRIPVIGRIVAGLPAPVPPSDFSYYDPETGIDIARSLLPAREKVSDLFALEVQGESMIDAMVNDGDIVIMKKVDEAQNGEMVAVWLRDRDETTLKYFYLEDGHVRLQPANPTMRPIIIDDPSIVQVQGKVVMVIRRVESIAV
ncbi:MAG: transcriptional repressor LexA [Anaerolineaceae bacterium]|nr:transcriptional repressor LexA [Anaerolineaceae bacterium]